jgi:rare lipoprotein A
MGRRAKLRFVALLTMGLGALPAAAAASSGGTGLPSGGTGLPTGGVSTTPTGTPAPVAEPSAVTVSGGGITLVGHTAGLLHGRVWFQGNVASGAAGKTVEIERLGSQAGAQWTPTATATTTSGGAFAALWRVNHVGDFSVRAILAGSSDPTQTFNLMIYRPSLATQYGPGFYGHRTACGIVLRKKTLGVANRTLKCGTRVSIYYDGRTMSVKVIDRGPYANGADWDVTEATGKILGMAGTETIGTIPAPTGN